MKRILIFSGLVLLVLSGFLIWRALHPPLSDEQQIAADLDAIAAAAAARDSATIAGFMAPTFSFNGQQTKRGDFKRQLYAGMTRFSGVDLQINGVQVQVNGTDARSDGRFLLNLKTDPNLAPEAHEGNFQLKWRKIDGQWKIVEVQGAPGVMG